MIIVRLGGGMGNQMFQYAVGRALSVKKNVALGLDLTYLLERVPRPAWHKFVFRNFDLGVFNISAEIVSAKEIPFIYKPFFSGKVMLLFDALRRKVFKFPGTEKSFQYDPNVFTLGSNSYLQGNWQSPKYFIGIEDIIRKDFSLKKPLSDKALKLNDEIQATISVCVNIRRTDFVTSSFHGIFGKEYYDKGIEHIAESRSIEKIYVFSDDMEWCKENLHFNYPTIFVGHEYAGAQFEEYLMLMKACKHFVIPNSSFAWWAAWLNTDTDKVVVAPKRWFLDDSIATDDLIPREWVRI
ncbi:MAG: alpha-1,2-fucosyltransferase [Patescibacteria group bacterium]